MGQHCGARQWRQRQRLFVSMAGFDVPGPEVRDAETGYPCHHRKGDGACGWSLSIPGRQTTRDPKRSTVVAEGLNGQRADRDAFLIGPTGLVLGRVGKTLLCRMASATVSWPSPDATTRTHIVPEPVVR